MSLQEEYPDKFISAVQEFLGATAGQPSGGPAGDMITVADTTPAAAVGLSAADAEAV